MKRIILSLAILLVFTSRSMGQINPISNLTWESQYDFGNYYFVLQWDEPALPHHELIGYNIYRDDELYRFQTQRFLADFGINVNCGQDFMAYESNGDGFVIHVTALYNSGSIESGYTETAFAENNLLKTDVFRKQRVRMYPNPTNGILNIENKNLTKILIYDISGKEIKELEPSSQLNLSDISKGIYLIKLISDQEVLIDKVVLK